MHQHWAVGFLWDAVPHIHNVVGRNAKYALIVSRVVYLAQRQSVRDYGVSARLVVGNDVSRIKQLAVP